MYEISIPVSPVPITRTVLSTPNWALLLKSAECNDSGTCSMPSIFGMLGTTCNPLQMAIASQS